VRAEAYLAGAGAAAASAWLGPFFEQEILGRKQKKALGLVSDLDAMAFLMVAST